MDTSNLKGELIMGLADAFNNVSSQKTEGSRYNQATGTLMTSNTFKNYALSLVSGEGFTKGKVYKCSGVENDLVHILADGGKEIAVNINDPDFSFKINPTKRDDSVAE